MEIYDYGTVIATGRTDGNGGGSIEFVTAEDSEPLRDENGSLKSQMMALSTLSGDGWVVVSSSTVTDDSGVPTTRYLVRRPTPVESPEPHVSWGR